MEDPEMTPRVWPEEEAGRSAQVRVGRGVLILPRCHVPTRYGKYGGASFDLNSRP